MIKFFNTFAGMCLICCLNCSLGSNLMDRDPFQSQKQTDSTRSDSTISTAVIHLNYANSTDVLALINKAPNQLLSSRGHVQSDARTNQLWVMDAPDNILSLKNFIQQIDIPVSQVVIKAKIVSIDDHYTHSLGILWGSQLKAATMSEGLTMDMPSSNFAGGVAIIPIAKLGEDHLLDLQLNALESDGHAEIISTPQLMTRDHDTAVIESGDDVPYQEKTGEGNTSIAFKKATLKLKVTPEIRPNHEILLHLEIHQDKVSNLTVNGVPAIHTHQLTTDVVVRNNETIALGGIYEDTRSNQTQGVPGVKKIPILKYFFQHTEHTTERKQLLIFITPKIVR